LKKSFEKPIVEPAEYAEGAGATSTELATVEAQPLALTGANAQVQGEIDAGDIRWPRLNLVQKSGDLSDSFTPGSFVFNKEIVLSDGQKPIKMVAMRIRKQYQEALPFDPSGPQPKVFNTSAEVRNAGGQTSAFGEEGYYKEIAHIGLLLSAPPSATDEQKDFFIYEFNDMKYALAMWTVASSAYTSVAKTLFTAATGHLKDGLHKGVWDLTSFKKSDARNSWFIPAIKAAGKNSPEFVAFAEGLLA
jgi:hypothetical protein